MELTPYSLSYLVTLKSDLNNNTHILIEHCVTLIALTLFFSLKALSI